jgi:5-formyltetrahydrofolate cyclo-ligase
MIRKLKAESIFLYIPLGIEVDIDPLIRRLRRQHLSLFVPFMEGESFRLVKYRMPLEMKQYGIKEPRNSRVYRKRDIDLAIVPMIGTDPTLRRVGFGKGMYDRFFEREKKYIKKTVFVSRILCQCKSIVTDHYDVAADMIVTPEKILYRKNSRQYI